MMVPRGSTKYRDLVIGTEVFLRQAPSSVILQHYVYQIHFPAAISFKSILIHNFNGFYIIVFIINY